MKAVARLWRSVCLAITLGVMLGAPSAFAQKVTIGVISSLTGPLAPFGQQLRNGMRLYEKLHKSELPPGVVLDIVTLDDGGEPAKAAALAQELVTRYQAKLVTGIISTPIARAVASVTTTAKVPLLVMGAADPKIAAESPYIASVATTILQETRPLGRWAATRGFKTSYVAVADYPTAESSGAAFTRAFEAAGGKLVGKEVLPLAGFDFTPSLLKLRQATPDLAFLVVPPGKPTAALLSQLREAKPDGTNIAVMPRKLSL